ncbi:MAG: hypothetical protein L0332_34485 [Chloroflexi bacterium]|nr:hypothetical protein [Chloroflexota bacterium]
MDSSTPPNFSPEVVNCIELPADEFCNRAYTHSGTIIIQAEYLEEEERLLVLGPEGMMQKGYKIRSEGWRPVNHEPGPISELEWVSMVLAIPGLPKWMHVAAEDYRNYLESQS